MAKSRSSIGTVETVETNKSPERILWKAVLATAVKDALKKQGAVGWISPADKTLARQWFLFPNIGFYHVCEIYTSLEKEKENYVFAASYPFNLSKIKSDNKLLKVLNEMKVTFKVKTPSVISETSGKKTLANVAEWAFSAEGTPFTKSDGRFVVKFDSSQLTFLDDKKSE